ncbi:hypothetical protein AVEN_268053-1 [Araneus ventricosus]|uniref:Uncharacterized protein n=1 Tax=Araneus ventricosus TaxID=182803 RepID=A0A4Y2R7F7_ARAVE|nr:hypothetical protein AVEN_268053-1 [Araneus ventricosus]
MEISVLNLFSENSVMNMESCFPAMLVLWLGREFYKDKHGVMATAVPGHLTLATILVTNLTTLRQIDDSRECNPFLDISIRKGNMLEYTRKLHVTSRPVGENI